MTCQALEAHQEGVQAVGQLHTAINQSQTASLRLRILVILTMIGSLQILQFMHGKDKF